MVNKDLVKKQSEGLINSINDLTDLNFKLTHYVVESKEHYNKNSDVIKETIDEKFTFECINGNSNILLVINKNKIDFPYSLSWKKIGTFYSNRCVEKFKSGSGLINFIDDKFNKKK